ncbi:START domain-containing protein [Reichenbachiella ulvae]|uniref:START domain-containing protein n=1 Tax=Reichenbachiella ulvae TaxID=2980104 RepID=A0ABT3CU69_9BACT|nr:START domain-containing protein [Reichenbachiella ulvae]MCV9387142.1 START domain-containing protein [Reichenbachiella ulvae]
MIRVFTWIVLGSLPVLGLAQDWQYAKTEDGIKVYTRSSELSPVKEFRATGWVQADPGEVLKALLDFEHYRQWYDHCEKAELLEKQSDSTMTYYLELAMPFPFSNRDAVLDLTIQRTEEEIRLSYMRNATAREEIDGVVRMPVSEGIWILKPKEQGTEVLHQFKGDPAGNVPPSMANLFVVAGPISTLTELGEYLDRME